MELSEKEQEIYNAAYHTAVQDIVDFLIQQRDNCAVSHNTNRACVLQYVIKLLTRRFKE